MGSTLFLIITFNLALAHHLKAVSLLSSSSSTAAAAAAAAAPSSLIAETLQLYELTNNWQHRLSSFEEEQEDDYEYESNDDDDLD